MTSSYIRGIDFKLSNKKAIELGGFHGIVTFQIESEADEIQANGRVARQGKPGSIIRIISRIELDILNIASDEANPMDLIPQKRKELNQKLSLTIKEDLAKCKVKHDETIKNFTGKFDQK